MCIRDSCKAHAKHGQKGEVVTKGQAGKRPKRTTQLFAQTAVNGFVGVKLCNLQFGLKGFDVSKQIENSQQAQKGQEYQNFKVRDAFIVQ